MTNLEYSNKNLISGPLTAEPNVHPTTAEIRRPRSPHWFWWAPRATSAATQPPSSSSPASARHQSRNQTPRNWLRPWAARPTWRRPRWRSAISRRCSTRPSWPGSRAGGWRGRGRPGRRPGPRGGAGRDASIASFCDAYLKRLCWLSIVRVSKTLLTETVFSAYKQMVAARYFRRCIGMWSDYSKVQEHLWNAIDCTLKVKKAYQNKPVGIKMMKKVPKIFW